MMRRRQDLTILSQKRLPDVPRRHLNPAARLARRHHGVNGARGAWTWTWTALLLAILLLCTAQPSTAQGPGGDPPAAAQEPTGEPAAPRRALRIGVLTALSGRDAWWGEAQLRALRLGFDDLVRERSAPTSALAPERLELVVRDSRSNPDAAALAAYALIHEEKVQAIIGPLLSDTAPTVFWEAVYGRTPIITASATAEELLEMYRPWAFRNTSLPNRAWRRLLPWWLRQHGVQRPVLWVENDARTPFLRGLALRRQFSALTGRRLADVRSLHAADFLEQDRLGAAAPELGAQRADGMIVIAFPHHAAMAVRALRRGGLRLPIFGDPSFSNPLFTEIGGESVDGVIFATDYWPERPFAPWQDFRRRFAEPPLGSSSQRLAPPAAAVAAYDTLRILHDAARRGRIFAQPTLAAQRAALRDALEQTTDFPGLMGRTSFGADGEARKEVFLLTVRQGVIVPLEAGEDVREDVNR
ncbi:MAG: ABC transporter substrate-binding protein [Candidatus Tectomicrobia bacterium]|nr:ABC transporter substrate-binding protein [Candidatus Tectomicrobia bacterium]